MQFEILNFPQKIWIFPTLALIFSVKLPGILAFF